MRAPISLSFGLSYFPFSAISTLISYNMASRKLVRIAITVLCPRLVTHLPFSQAIRFYTEFSPSLGPSHSATLHHLSTLLLPAHVQNDELAQRFRNEKYTIRMSRSGFDLLVGWLTEGVGGEATGQGEGFSGEKGKRGRAAMLRVVNNHLRFDGMLQPTRTSRNTHEMFISNAIVDDIRLPERMGRVYGSLVLRHSPGEWKCNTH